MPDTINIPPWCEKVVIQRDTCGWIVSLHGDSHGIGVAHTELASGPTLPDALGNCTERHEGWTRYVLEKGADDANRE